MQDNGNRKELGPIAKSQRIGELDLIRGVALLGIIIANMPLFSYPYLYTNLLSEPWWTTVWDRAVQQLTYIFIDFKFITIFSFLFGLGFMIFLQRAEQKGRNRVWLYLKRLLVLMAIGLIHSYFIWFGDILFLYAFMGFFLIFFRNCRGKTLLIWSLGLLVIPAALLAVLTFAGDGGWLGILPSIQTVEELIAESLVVYGQGTYGEIFEQRLVDLAILQENSLFLFPLTLSMFLLGAYTWKQGLFLNLAQHTTLIRQIRFWSLIIGIPFLILQVFLFKQFDLARTGYNFVHYIGIMVAGPAICLFYMSSLLLLARNKRWNEWLTPLQAVGRMALTNYILQSLICTFLFYSYGFGLYNQIGPALCFLISIGIFSLQVAGSNLWLKHFQFGPLEWIWRMLTYGKWQSIQIAEPNKNQTVSSK